MSEAATGTNHTPGPWHIDEDGMVTTDEGYYVASVEALGICDDPEARQNLLQRTRLILAAPDMLEALEGMLALHIAHHNEPAHVRARTAIAKAKGGDDV